MPTVYFTVGFKAAEIGEIRRMVADRRAEVIERWLNTAATRSKLRSHASAATDF